MNLNILNSIWRKQAEPWHRQADSDSKVVAMAAPAVAASHSAEIRLSDSRRFVARQTIFDRSRDVYGYELLFRSGWENCFRGDTEDATRKMIADGALYGFHELTQGAPSFVNCTRESLVNGLVTFCPPPLSSKSSRPSPATKRCSPPAPTTRLSATSSPWTTSRCTKA